MIDKLLADREERYNIILDLIEKYNLPLVCGKVNYPGPDKDTKTANKIFNIIVDQLNLYFKDFIVFSKTLEGYDGKSRILLVNMDKIQAKKLGVSIEENNKLGRVFDIDIYAGENGSLTRKELDLPSRKCIICGEDPAICRRLNKHELIDVLNKIDEMHIEYTINPTFI